MNGFELSEYKKEIWYAYKEVLVEKQNELKIINDKISLLRKQIGKIYVDYKIAGYIGNSSLVVEQNDKFEDKRTELSNFIDTTLGTKRTLENVIETIEGIIEEE